jgi:DNA-binding transcriptional LysR family regulator
MTWPVDLLTLRIVVAVVDSGSISAGSQRADLALGAASARIAALEQALGVSLFERSPRGVRTTPAGHVLAQRARELLADADRLSVDLQDLSQGLAGRVRVLANASAILEWLPPRLAAFGHAHPRIRVELEERGSPEIALALLDGQADLGIVDLMHPLQGLRLTGLFEDQLALIAPRGHRLTAGSTVSFAEVLAEDLVGLYDGNAISARLAAEARALGRPLRTQLQLRSFDAVCRMVAAGLGVGVLPLQAVHPQLQALPIVALPLQDGWARRTHRLVQRDGVPLPPAAQLLLQALTRSG